MRNLIFSCVAVLGMAGCGDTTTTPTPVKDLSVKASPDLTQPLNGYIACGNAGGMQSCYDDCDAGATQGGLDLLNAFGTCIDDNCYNTMNTASHNADSGKPYCDNMSMNPTADPVCNDCYGRILG